MPVNTIENDNIKANIFFIAHPSISVFFIVLHFAFFVNSIEYVSMLYRIYLHNSNLARLISCKNLERIGNILEPDKDFNLTVGLRIREIREAHNMTREQFSEKCDISDSFLAAVENGQKSITSKTLYKICTSMNVSADYLIRGKNNGFEDDMLMELLNSMDKYPREAAIRILREYISVVNHLKHD